MDWRIEEVGFDRGEITSRGNKFLTGNGYLGIRGTLPEYEKGEYPAINLAGIYDQAGDGWREPLNAPNGLFTYLKMDDVEYRLPNTVPVLHKMALDYRHGIFLCKTVFSTPGGKVTIQTERFASLADHHLIAMKYCILTEGEGSFELVTGIDGEVWDINGPHFEEMLLTEDNQILCVEGIAHECRLHGQVKPLPGNRERVYVSEACHIDYPVKVRTFTVGRKILRSLTFSAEAGAEVTLYKYISVYTSKDGADSQKKANVAARKAKEAGYASVLKENNNKWEKKWSISEVTIEGDNAAMEALNYSIYHLHSIAPRHSDHLSIAARGLSGQTYKGAVFWDTEMFMLDFFLFTEPEVAKSLLKYRITTLEGARNKARQYGYRGAFYAWESQEGGYDACSNYNVTDVFTGRKLRTYFKDKQVHISAAVVYGIMRYMNYTGSLELLAEGGAEVILECARFYQDLLVKRVSKDYYEIHDVIGPDEYHERVNNNAYTNRMAKYTFDSAVAVIRLLPEIGAGLWNSLSEQYDLEVLLEEFLEASGRLFIPQPDQETGIIEQFDGYMDLEEVGLEDLKSRMLHEKEYWGGANGIASHTKIIKQADVVTMINLFSDDYSRNILLKNWNYYEPKTEHGSSLSACMYAILACKCNMPDQAYPFFMKSAAVDLTGEGKEWAGLIYIGGTHPASSGGAYMTAIEGFAGIREEYGELKADPRLPKKWTRLQFRIVFRGNLYEVDISKTNASINKLV